MNFIAKKHAYIFVTEISTYISVTTIKIQSCYRKRRKIISYIAFSYITQDILWAFERVHLIWKLGHAKVKWYTKSIRNFIKNEKFIKLKSVLQPSQCIQNTFGNHFCSIEYKQRKKLNFIYEHMTGICLSVRLNIQIFFNWLPFSLTFFLCSKDKFCKNVTV